jgi:hypothetical protein
MTTQEIADRLVDMCRHGNIEEAKEELFAPDIVSIEPREGLLPKETKGMDAIRKKAALFVSMVDSFYGDTISDAISHFPFLRIQYFSTAGHGRPLQQFNQRKTKNTSLTGHDFSLQFPLGIHMRIHL